MEYQQVGFTKDTWSGYAFASREGLKEWPGRHPRLLIVELLKEGEK